MIETAVAAGLLEDPGFLNSIPEEQQLKTEAAVTHSLDVSAQVDRKEQATFAHATQFGEDSMFRKMPADVMRQVWSSEHFIQVMPAVSAETSISLKSDLFD